MLVRSTSWKYTFGNSQIEVICVNLESVFRNMLAQPVFAQRVCMGVDKYAFEVEGYSPLYCWWGVHLENIRLATLKLRSFASIWNQFFKKYADSANFCSKGMHGSGQICIWGWRILSGVLLMRSRFWKYTFGNSQIEVICVNLESAFQKYADSVNFCTKSVHGSGQICIWGWRLLPDVLLMRSRFWKYTFGNSQIEVICVNLESVF